MTSADGWELPQRRPDGTDWDRAVAAGPYRAHHALRRAIGRNALGEGSAGAWRLVIGRDREAEVDSLLGRLNGPDHAAALRSLYRELILAEPNPDVLLAALRRRIARALRTIDPENRAPTYAWPVATCCYAAARAFQATGDRRFFNLVADTFAGLLPFRDRVLGKQDECRDRIGPGWGGTQFARGKYTTNITSAGRIVYPVVLLHGMGPPGERLQGVLEVAEEVLTDLDGDFVTSGDEGLYPRPCSDRPEPVNHMAWAGSAFLELAAVTGNEAYREQAARIARFLRNSLREDGSGGIVWGYAPSLQDRDGGPERVWKAQVTTQFMAVAETHGIEFDRDDLRRVGETLLHNVFLPGGGLNTRIDRVAEPFETFRGTVYGGRGSVVALLELERYVPELRPRIMEFLAADPGAGGWFGSAPATIGYARLLTPAAGIGAGD